MRRAHMMAATADSQYDASEIEARWQARWAEDRIWAVDVERLAPGRKFYNLVEFPYPSAEGLHVGHAYTYAGADTYGRYLRMRGGEVFQPIGFDSFGIHTRELRPQVGRASPNPDGAHDGQLPAAAHVAWGRLGFRLGEMRTLALRLGNPSSR
jgi:hypothetical protein